MTKIGQKPIFVPEGINLNIENDQITISRADAKITIPIPRGISLTQTAHHLSISRNLDNRELKARHGLIRAQIFNAVLGLTDGFQKKLAITGVGYRIETNDGQLVLHLGFSHPITLDIPADLTISIQKNIICVSGIDKQLVGEFAAKIRSWKSPEPYKGKGIRYLDEEIKRKPGKTVKTVGSND